MTYRSLHTVITSIFVLSAQPALAQAYQCVPPARIAPSLRAVEQDGPPRRTPIGGFTLAASWSPEYCKSAGGRSGSSYQCSGEIGRFGFILHGLWPESNSGPPPQWCSLTPRPSPEVLRRNLCMTPDPYLLEHEWAKHGSCMARTPDAYFRASAALWQSLRLPDADRLSRNRALTAGDLRDAFLAANPDWRREQVGIDANPRGWLKELRLCYSARYMPAACARRTYGLPDSAPLKIWRGL